MSAELEIVSPGAFASIQDFGRLGWRRLGVPVSGALDRRLLRIANRLAGNAEDAPAIECFDGGQRFAAHEAPLRLAVAGAAVLELEGPDGTRRPLAAWRSLTLTTGESLRVRRIEGGRLAVVAVAGLAVTPALGSASTYGRAALGGWQGRALAAGDRLSATPVPPGPDHLLPDPPPDATGPVRVVMGPQHDHFAPESVATFLAAEYRIGSAADRMGLRLEGPVLAHRAGLGHEIVSDATVPGAIQVPGNGQPIVLLADAQTAGGYPKIATVISADLARLAALRPGETVRFAALEAGTAVQLARDAEAATRALLATIRPLAAGGPDLAALYAVNLIGGAIDARRPDDAYPDTRS